MLYYTYLHRRASDNLPFYIGKGKGDRATRAHNRNPYWHRTVNRHGLKVEIVAHWPTEAEAFEHEKFLIWCFRDMGHKLVNLSDGGEGQSGYEHSEETKQKIRVSNTGRTQAQKQRAAASERMIGNKLWSGRAHTDETKARIGAGNKGKLAGPRSPRFGKPIPESQKLAIAKATSGANHWNARQVTCIETGIKYETCGIAGLAVASKKSAGSSIAKAASGKLKTAYGYTWKFI